MVQYQHPIIVGSSPNTVHSLGNHEDTTASEAGGKVSQLMDVEETVDDDETIEMAEVHINAEEVAEILASLHERVVTAPVSVGIFTSPNYP